MRIGTTWMKFEGQEKQQLVDDGTLDDGTLRERL